MRVSIYNDGDAPIRVIPDQKAAGETLIDAGEEAIVEAEHVIRLVEIDDQNHETLTDDDESHDQDFDV